MTNRIDIKGFPAKVASKAISSIVSKKLGTNVTINLDDVVLLTNEDAKKAEISVNASAYMDTDDLQKLIFQGGKKNV